MSLSVRTGVYLVAATFLFLATGCGSASFIGQRYHNFTSYYNTFYNAEQSYEAGVRALESTEEPIDRMQYLVIFGGPSRPGGNVNFQNAIEKSTDILIDHPRSKWVDDALLLIGKSYFYQENYVGAEQKFQEVISFESSLEEEARIWLSRALMAVRSHERAQQHLASSLEREDISRRSRAQLRLALGELFVKQGDFDSAAEQLAAALPDVRSKELRAKGAFLLGQVYEALERYEDAVEAYALVRKERPPYELDYAASLSVVRVQGMHLDGAAALEALRRMDRDDKHYDRRAELAYVRGRIYQAQGLSRDALATYDHLLYEEENRDQTIRGLTHYALAELYRDVFRDYPLASAHFDTARTALASFSSPRPGSDAQYAPEAVTDTEEQADMFSDFAEVRARIARMDSLLALGSLSEEEFDERILAFQEQKAEELEEERRRAEQLQAERGFRDAASRTGAVGAGASSSAANIGEAGFLHHRDRARVQEARLNFVARWGERPHVPGWRRMEAVSQALSAREETEEGDETDASEGGADDMDLFALPYIDVSDVPRDSLSRAEMEEARALAWYELGNALFLSMNKADSAAVWYRMVIEENADAEVAQRAFYALAEVQRSLGDTVRAHGIYRQVLSDYPDSDFAARVRMELGLEPEETLDSLAVAQEEYDEAVIRWKDEAYEEAFRRMVFVASRYRDREVAAKALFAAGRIYFEWAASDSLDVLGPLSVTLPDSVLVQAGIIQIQPAPDTLAGSIQSAPDTLAAVASVSPESGEPAAPDSLQAEGAPDTPGAPGGNDAVPASDLLASADVDIVDLRSVYAGVRDLYPDTPYAERAGYILDVLDAEHQALQDSLSAADSLAAPLVSDSERVFADSLAVSGAPDSLHIPADSLAMPLAPDSLHVLADSLAMPLAPDSLHVLADSLTAPAPSDSLAAEQAGETLDSFDETAPPDQVAPPDEVAPSNQAAQTNQAGETPNSFDEAVPSDEVAPSDQGDQTNQAALPDQGALPEETRAPPDEGPGQTDESPVPLDEIPAFSDEFPGPPDEGLPLPEETDALLLSEIPAGEFSLYGPGGIQSALGGFTIALDAHVEREPMEALVAPYAQQGLRAAVVVDTVDDSVIYLAAIGHFPSEEAAETGLQGMRYMLGDIAQLARVVPLNAP